MGNVDKIRWIERLQHLKKALARLEEACSKTNLNELEEAGLVQVFEFTFELLWKTLKDFLFFQGFSEKSPRSVIRRGFEAGYINEGDSELLLLALQNRNLLSHTYEEELAKKNVSLIKEEYYPVLKRVYDILNKKKDL